MPRSHGTTSERETPEAVRDVQIRPARVGAERPSRAHARSRTVAAIGAWLGTSTWPAYCAAGITAAYGLLKAYWVFGGTALWSIAPLSPEVIDEVRSHTAPTWFLVADAVSVVLAVAGVWFALVTAPTTVATGMAGPMGAVAARHVHGGAALDVVDPR
jgi:hypothetical protein